MECWELQNDALTARLTETPSDNELTNTQCKDVLYILHSLNSSENWVVSYNSYNYKGVDWNIPACCTM